MKYLETEWLARTRKKDKDANVFAVYMQTMECEMLKELRAMLNVKIVAHS